MAERIKSLTPQALEKLQKMEKKWGHCVVAYEKFPPAATITADELKELESLEKEFNAVLVDYQC